ncbi:phosphate ABC transporter permease PstA [Motiliproteus sp. MSK22-1]|uniref:phosphate ABC transporter permease PstA n=1 Tax=Motiliproteus sp. MSK22-1 TaxID=1897630 RepID=UPI000976E91A|nr:phosphate ABC transporter permease PstA [Motiliproteus sp. MSK22-1]OMH29088.1 phosphate ABC transporter, permease protein PstA [Motiliproteus sp. MSK22-1]
MKISVNKWFASGSPWIFLNAAAVAISVIMVAGLLILIAVRGLGHFWPADIIEAEHIGKTQTTRVIGEIADHREVSTDQLRDAGYSFPAEQETASRLLLKVGNRDVGGADFRWVLERELRNSRYPETLFAAERTEWGNFYGYLKEVKEGETTVASLTSANHQDLWNALQERIARARQLHEQIYEIEKHEIGTINHGLERLRLKSRSLELKGELTAAHQAELAADRAVFDQQYKGLQARLSELYRAFERDSMIAEAMDGSLVEVKISKVVRAYLPNSMNVVDKIGFYCAKLWEFVSDEPREANTEGGVFPAIFGTVMMVLLMSVLVTPFGVIAAVYLREYAKQGLVTRIIRIAVNNLAGVPSIVYGVFGLGFFIYFLGGNIDQLFFPEALPAPTFGTPGLLWASLTLALLTVPVVIVATEEGLSRIPRSLREGSLALGATKAETLWRVVLPMSSPAIMTGVILAVARAAGEVAPLMLVGVVKLAPSLPLDGNYPFLHLDQKFMHLGFHIYDVGFQSPNVEAARPLVYATALLLVAVIALLNFLAVTIRNRLREKYKALEN